MDQIVSLFNLNINQLVANQAFYEQRKETTVKPVLNGHSKRRPKNVFQDRLSLNEGQMYCRMLQERVLQ